MADEDDEIERRARELYENQDVPAGHYLPPWQNTAEIFRNTWRALARGDAGAAVD
jgi:hypothetical protein